jgi:hypothetical protein
MSLLYQLDASVIGTMFSDTGKTTQVTNGGTVAAWTAPSGSITTDALQSTSGNRPTYRSNYSSSGYAAVEFDGTNDMLSVSHSSGWNVSVIDVFLVMLCGAAEVGSFRGLITKFSSTSWTSAWGTTYSDGALSFGAPSYLNVTCKAVVGSRLLMHVHFEANCNGAAQGHSTYGGSTVGAGPTNTTASVFVGGAFGGNNPFSGAIHELRVYGGGETNQTLVDVKNALASKWGLASVSSGKPQLPFMQQVIG